MINTNSSVSARWPFASIIDGTLAIENQPLELLAKKFGTPFYLLVESEIRTKLRRFLNAFPYSNFHPQYAVKCNSNIQILKIIKEEGFEADASSIGEIILSMLAGFSPEQITFTNLYKSEADILFAAKLGVKAITIDSHEELRRAVKAAEKCESPLRIFLRMNAKLDLPGYDTMHHQYGIPIDQAKDAIDSLENSKNIEIVGIHWHGAYVPSPEVYHIAMRKIIPIAAYAKEKGHPIKYLDFGGGFPVKYGDEIIFTPEDMGEGFISEFTELCLEYGLDNPCLIFEPGKFIVASSGVGVMKVVSVKDLGEKKIAVVDGSTYAMLPDPLIWECNYQILPANKMENESVQKIDIHGCTCDCLDKIGKEKDMPELTEGDIIAVMDTGAYSNVIASNFNTLKRPPMLMLKEDGQIQIIRRRDRYSEMFAPELEVVKTDGSQQLKDIYNLIRQATLSDKTLQITR